MPWSVGASAAVLYVRLDQALVPKMALKLTVLSEQHASLGARASIVVWVGGGTIGRAHDNDWVLPDPNRYLSAHHARVKFRDGAYHLIDTSSNGVFINDRVEALGRRSSYVLRD